MNIFTELSHRIHQLAGNDYLYFDSSLSISCPHSPSFKAWGCCTSPEGRIYLMDFKMDWHEVGSEDQRVAAPLLKKINQLHKQKSIKS